MSLLAFGPFALDPNVRTLNRDGRAIELQPLAYDLLEYGVRRPGTLLDRDALRHTLWPDVVVTDHSLTQLVHRIRKALGEHRGLWVTVPRRGYRFDGQVRQIEAGSPSAAGSMVARPARDSFIGRGVELARLADNLAVDPPRPMVVHGPGGAGKTRLALEFLKANRKSWSSIVPINLSADRERAEVVARAATALHIQLPSGPTAEHEQRVARSLEHRAASAILLDNLEQLTPQARELLAQWVRAAPHHAWLATSRDVVDLPDAVHLLLPPLPSDSSVALFRARAAAVGAPLPAPDDADLHAILSTLEGSPLAIELAAARLPLLGLGAMRSRLSDVLTVLAGRRTGVPRHRSMAAATAWSWQLLDDTERLVLMAGALFPESFTLAAVEFIVAALRPGVDTLSVMHRLLDLSLLEPPSARPDRRAGRLSYARTVRAFALEQLEISPHAEPLRRGFDAVMRRLFERARGLPDRWDRELAAEVVPELSALELALNTDRTSRADRVVLGRICHSVYALHRSARILQSLGDETAEDGVQYWLLVFCIASREQVASVLEREPYQPLIDAGGADGARLLAAVGGTASELGNTGRALNALQRAQALAARHASQAIRAQIALALAVVHLRRGDIEQAEIEAELGLGAAGDDGGSDARSLAGLLDLRGYLYSQKSEFERAKHYHAQAQGHARSLGLERMRARFLCNLGSTLQESGEYVEALQQLDQAIEIAARQGDRVLYHAFANRGLTYLHLGDTVSARRDLSRIDAAVGGPWLHVMTVVNRAAVDAAEQRWEASKATAERAVDLLAEMPGLTVLESAALLWLTLACAKLGESSAVHAHRSRQDALPQDGIPDFLQQAWKQVQAEIEGVDLPVPPGAHALVHLVARVRGGPQDVV